MPMLDNLLLISASFFGHLLDSTMLPEASGPVSCGPTYLGTTLLCCMQGMDETAMSRASKQITHALASAERCTGSCTTYISLVTEHIGNLPANDPGHPANWPISSTLANVACLELQLTCYTDVNDDFIRAYTRWTLGRLPNLVAARLWLEAPYSICPYVDLHHLKHLELGVGDVTSVGCVDIEQAFPSLGTACISASVEPGTNSILDFSECRHLTRLVFANIMVYDLYKPPGCTVRVEMVRLQSEDLVANWLRQGLAEVSELLLSSKELYSHDGLLTKARMPKLEVIRCDGWGEDSPTDGNSSDSDGNDAANPDDIEELEFLVTRSLENCMMHSRNFPALRSILIADNTHSSQEPVMCVVIPYYLARVQELMIASERPVELVFGCAHMTGERLETFCVVGKEVKVDRAAMTEMRDALSGRGLTLSMVKAKKKHEHYPSECLYVHPSSAPQLSFDDAILALDARIERWGDNKNACGQCGACFKCLRKAGILDSY